MTDFNDLLRNYATEQEAASNGRTILAYLADAMAPFRCRDATIEVWSDIDIRVYVLEVRARNLPWFLFRYRFSHEDVVCLFDTNVLFIEAGLAIRDYWRSFVWITPEDHIELGEN